MPCTAYRPPKIFDLLAGGRGGGGGGDASQQLDVKQSPEGGVHVPGAQQATVGSAADVAALLAAGAKARATLATAMNERSSRSHLVRTVHVVSEREEGAGSAQRQQVREGKQRVAHLLMVMIVCPPS
jgi:hypothetical protein